MSTEPIKAPDKLYESKRDTWIVITLWVVILFLSASAIYITFLDISIPLMISQEILFLGTVAFCFSILRSTNYRLLSDRLIVRSGPFRWTILFADINKVVPERNLWSGAALSIRRLHITHSDSKMGSYISPAGEATFLADLAERCPHLEFDGRGLGRRGTNKIDDPKL